MTQTTYVLKTKRGASWMSFDNLARAREVQAERAAKHVTLRLVEQTIVERELEDNP